MGVNTTYLELNLNKRYGEVQRFVSVGKKNYYISKGGVVFYITDDNFHGNQYKPLERCLVNIQDYKGKLIYVEINNVKFDIKKLVATYFLKDYEYGDKIAYKDNDYHNCKFDNLVIIKRKERLITNGI